MRVPPERRAELHAEALKRIARSSENGYRRDLLAECLEAYADLNEAERQQLQELLTTAPYQEVGPLMITTYERGKIDGKKEGQREMVVLLLEAKFGRLAPAVKQRAEGLALEQLQQLLLDLVEGRSLKDMHLED